MLVLEIVTTVIHSDEKCITNLLLSLAFMGLCQVLQFQLEIGQ